MMLRLNIRLWFIQQTNFQISDVSKAGENISSSEKIRTSYGLEVNRKEYSNWILAKNNNQFSEPEKDLDGDGLDNIEILKLKVNGTIQRT